MLSSILFCFVLLRRQELGDDTLLSRGVICNISQFDSNSRSVANLRRAKIVTDYPTPCFKKFRVTITMKWRNGFDLQSVGAERFRFHERSERVNYVIFNREQTTPCVAIVRCPPRSLEHIFGTCIRSVA